MPDGDRSRTTVRARAAPQIYRRYAIADEAMLKEGAVKLAAFHAIERKATPKVISLKKRKS